MTLSGRTFVVLEILVFVVFSLASKALITMWTWKYAGPITLISTLILLSLYMRRSGKSWAQYGLKPLPGIKSKLMVLPQAMLVFLAFAIAVGSVMLIAKYFQISVLLEVSEGVEARFGEVRDNLPKLMMWLTIIWVSAAFGEEMFFRGYLVARIQEALPNSWLATVIAIVVPALIFGYGHYGYQGIRGFIMTGMIAVAFGLTYLLLKKNLWPNIVVHGVVDSVAFISLYLGTD
ncbi:CPBP family intramembrane metalloprotease [Aestuariibacter halophilus]|uniref:CPBP family intramembrane metalloprotease n=1 Tax=Fluctibacter halophilus TaxID=226011 RepID=A0ABS8G698_9ALTE|nr:CPBP family intramembrane glutamic endopeptidase [Aestuariibacter halophilus]MCC2616060.1 CPBP family intramembrane metalloprotease [Aestuariibacter halophilus]